MRSLKALSFTLLITFTASVLPTIVHAQEENPISIFSTPTADYFVLQPGEYYEDEFVVANMELEGEVEYYIDVSGFRQAGDLPGSAIPLSDEEDARDPYSASEWVTVETDKITLPAQKNIEIGYTIKVPDNAALGEYHLKIFLTSEDPDLDSNQSAEAGSNLGVGPSILIQVGDIEQMNQTASLLKFTNDKYVYEKANVIFLTEIQNDGNTHITPQGSILVSNFLGDTVAELTFNEANQSLIRGNSGEFDTLWVDDGLITSESGKIIVGPMKAQLVFQYADINPGYSAIQATTSFWIIPWKLILAILGAIILLITALVVVKKKRSKKKNASKPKQS